LAYDSVNSRWYYNDYREDGDRTNNKLYFHDGISQTLAGSLPYEIAAGGFDNGKYYFIDSYPATDDLYEVTLNSDGTINTITKVADISNNAHAWTFNGDIAVKNGIVYGWGRNGNTYEFFKVNVDGTGFTYNVPGYQLSLQLAFGSDGILYGHRSDRIGGPWFVVPATDGEVDPNDPVSSPGVSFTDAASGGLCVPKTETAWGEGFDFPGNNWAMYFNYDLSDCYEPQCEEIIQIDEQEPAKGPKGKITGAAVLNLVDSQTGVLGIVCLALIVSITIISVTAMKKKK